MSQTTAEEFETMHNEYVRGLHRRGLRGGPEYRGDESAPLVWYDQLFARAFTPSGTVQAPKALRAGATQNGLDVILVASHENEEDLAIAAGSTITLTTLEGDGPDDDFTPVGPAICVTAPDDGIKCAPDMLAARFAIGNFKKPWLKVELEFSGTISGGTMDCGLGYVAR